MAKATNNITNFLAEVRNKGLSRPNRFEISIQNPPCVTNKNWGQKVNMFCDQAIFPQTRIITSRQQLFGPPEFRPVGVDYGGDNLGLQFLVDREMQVKQYFDSWMDGIVNRTTYTTSYKQNYVTSMIIKQLDEADNITYQIKVEDVFPVVVNVLNLDHNVGSSVHKLNVTFNYRRWTVQAAGGASVPEFTKSSPLGNLRIQNGNIQYTNTNLTAQQQAQNLLSPGYNPPGSGTDTYFIVN
jgi:hypothetical protein